MSLNILDLPLPDIRPNPFQPRAHFNEETLDELADSIRRHGVLQPITVRKHADTYFLVAGERRLRAAERAGLETIPAIVRALDNRGMLETALVENLQREDINPVEAARGYQRLAEEFGLTHGEIAQRTGKSRAAVANAFRLLQLPGDVLEDIERGEITEGHARALLQLDDPAERRALCEHIIQNGLSVREAERAAQRATGSEKVVTREVPAQRAPVDPLITDLVERLRRHFGTKVSLEYGSGRGSVTIAFFSDEDLTRIVDLLGI